MKLWYLMIDGNEVDALRAKTQEQAERRAAESGYKGVTVQAA